MKSSALQRKMHLRRQELAGKAVEEPERQIKRQAFDRKALFDRDGGRCQNCGLNMHEMKQQYLRADFVDKQILLEDHAIPTNRINGDWWDGHHTVEVVKGGTKDLDGLVTLCLKCHRIETNKLMAEKAKALRRAKRFNPAYRDREPLSEEVL